MQTATTLTWQAANPVRIQLPRLSTSRGVVGGLLAEDERGVKKRRVLVNATDVEFVSRPFADELVRQVPITSAAEQFVVMHADALLTQLVQSAAVRYGVSIKLTTYRRWADLAASRRGEQPRVQLSVAS